MRIAYVHILPLEYYPPASNFLDLLGRQNDVQVQVYTMANRKDRDPYMNAAIKLIRGRSPDPASNRLLRMLVVVWWHMSTAISLRRFKPDAVIYIEPHSAICAWIYFKIFGGKARLFIHHHEYYEPQDFYRPGMRLPRLGNRLEHNLLFARAEWISQTNNDRLGLARRDFPEVAGHVWRVLPNYPPRDWSATIVFERREVSPKPLRLVYVGSASFDDTYIQEIVKWVVAHPTQVQLHICGYNIAPSVWDWLEKEQFSNVTFDSNGYSYEELPRVLQHFDVGLVLYKGNTSNFIYNVPNKVFEYLLCGLEVWYPKEMASIRNFQKLHSVPLREVDLSALTELDPAHFQMDALGSFETSEFTTESACTPMLETLGVEVVTGCH